MRAQGFDVKTWLRWTVAFVAFPPAGLLARTVAGPVDDVGTALLSGALAGLVIGAGQWTALRRSVPVGWIPATAGGLAVGLALGAGLVGYRTGIGDLAAMGAATGLGAGIGQWWLLRDWMGHAVLWPVGTALCWALGWAVTTSIGVDVAMQWPVFGASGALVAMALSGTLLTVLRGPGRTSGLSGSGAGGEVRDEP